MKDEAVPNITCHLCNLIVESHGPCHLPDNRAELQNMNLFGFSLCKHLLLTNAIFTEQLMTAMTIMYSSKLIPLVLQT